MIHVGVTATRMGLSPAQLYTARRLMDEEAARHKRVVFHHGDCVGGDQQLDSYARHLDWYRVAHPGPKSGWSANCDSQERRGPVPYMLRNRDIVDESPDLVIAAPYEMEPQPRGGTWGTIAMARRALKAGKLARLVVVGRDGSILDHDAWRLKGA